MAVTRRQLLAGAAALLAAPRLARAASPVQVLGGPAFGSSWRVVAPAAAESGAVRAAVEAVIADVDATMSPYRADADLARFNRASPGEFGPVADEVCVVAAEALAVHGMTGGAFDPTVGPMVRRMGFGPIEGAAGPAKAIEVGARTLAKHRPGLTLDLCGIAKGRALDRIAAALRGLGVEALIELGGEVRGLGTHPEGRDWQVAVERPLAGPFAAQRIVAPGARALATSGHVANGFAARGRALSHLIDPRTGRPADQSVLSVTVLASAAMRADALATALCVMGAEAGPAFAEGAGVAALFLLRGAYEPHEIMTGDFARAVLA